MSIWDNPELKVGGEFVTFDQEGDNVAGTITVVRTQKWPDGKVDPQLLLVTDDGEEKTVTCGQVRLKAELAQQRPEAGDHISITLTRIEPRAGGKSLKHFTVEVKRGDGGGAVPAAPASVDPPAAPAANDPEAFTAAVANLSEEQRKALGL